MEKKTDFFELPEEGGSAIYGSSVKHTPEIENIVERMDRRDHKCDLIELEKKELIEKYCNLADRYNVLTDRFIALNEARNLRIYSHETCENCSHQFGMKPDDVNSCGSCSAGRKYNFLPKDPNNV